MDYPLLSQIASPQDLKGLKPKEREKLARDIRSRMIEVLSATGGHLASNLGVVELSIALHTVFDSPRDKFTWDVSHQTYVHKLLTGRNDRFEEIRQFEGLCGFALPDESEHDHFHVGHAGTALSQALGLAKARDLCKEDNFVIPVIGDASLTCGLTLEALNNVGANLKRFVVILNDNAMSISKNVGRITHILSRMLSNPTSQLWYEEIAGLLKKIPGYGKQLVKSGHRFTESLKNLVSPAVFFEHYGLHYIGPVDGHDVNRLVDTLERVRDSNQPLIIHVLTEKGHGMTEAVKDPACYHGAKPFSVETGKFLPASSVRPTFPKVFGKQILEMANEDPDLVAVTPAMPLGSCLTAFMEKHPDRCLDVGIAEGHAVTFAGALAYQEKKKVICSIYSTFLQRAFDNLFQDVCLQEIPVVFCLDRAGISGPDGSTHHGIYDISFLNAMPNMVIATPRNGQVLRELLVSAFDWKKPTAIRYPNLATEVEETKPKKRALGRGEVLAEGEDLLILSMGHMCQTALKVREALLEKGIRATVVDPVFAKPLDEELLHELLECHQNLVTLEEHSVSSGLGVIVNNFLMTKGHESVKVLNLGIPDIFVRHGANGKLLKSLGLDAEGVTQKICESFPLLNLELHLISQ